VTLSLGLGLEGCGLLVINNNIRLLKIDKPQLNTVRILVIVISLLCAVCVISIASR